MTMGVIYAVTALLAVQQVQSTIREQFRERFIPPEDIQRRDEEPSVPENDPQNTKNHDGEDQKPSPHGGEKFLDRKQTENHQHEQNYNDVSFQKPSLKEDAKITGQEDSPSDINKKLPEDDPSGESKDAADSEELQEEENLLKKPEHFPNEKHGSLTTAKEPLNEVKDSSAMENYKNNHRNKINDKKLDNSFPKSGDDVDNKYTNKIAITIAQDLTTNTYGNTDTDNRSEKNKEGPKLSISIGLHNIEKKRGIAPRADVANMDTYSDMIAENKDIDKIQLGPDDSETYNDNDNLIGQREVLSVSPAKKAMNQYTHDHERFGYETDNQRVSGPLNGGLMDHTLTREKAHQKKKSASQNRGWQSNSLQERKPNRKHFSSKNFADEVSSGIQSHPDENRLDDEDIINSVNLLDPTKRNSLLKRLISSGNPRKVSSRNYSAKRIGGHRGLAKNDVIKHSNTQKPGSNKPGKPRTRRRKQKVEEKQKRSDKLTTKTAGTETSKQKKSAVKDERQIRGKNSKTNGSSSNSKPKTTSSPHKTTPRRQERLAVNVSTSAGDSVTTTKTKRHRLDSSLLSKIAEMDDVELEKFLETLDPGEVEDIIKFVKTRNAQEQTSNNGVETNKNPLQKTPHKHNTDGLLTENPDEILRSELAGVHDTPILAPGPVRHNDANRPTPTPVTPNSYGEVVLDFDAGSNPANTQNKEQLKIFDGNLINVKGLSTPDDKNHLESRKAGPENFMEQEIKSLLPSKKGYKNPVHSRDEEAGENIIYNDDHDLRDIDNDPDYALDQSKREKIRSDKQEIDSAFRDNMPRLSAEDIHRRGQPTVHTDGREASRDKRSEDIDDSKVLEIMLFSMNITSVLSFFLLIAILVKFSRNIKNRNPSPNKKNIKSKSACFETPEISTNHEKNDKSLMNIVKTWFNSSNNESRETVVGNPDSDYYIARKALDNVDGNLFSIDEENSD